MFGKFLYTIIIIMIIWVSVLVIDRQLEIFFNANTATEVSDESIQNDVPGHESLVDSFNESITTIEEQVKKVGDTVTGKSEVVEEDIILVEEEETTAIVTSEEIPSEVIIPASADSFELAEGELSVAGVVLHTNTERFQNDIPQLIPNLLLHKAAKIKINDMIDDDYFAHVSPITGRDVSYFTDGAGYEYILVGENLAVGDFESDAELVQGWMDSPGHRENILNERYTEIGVAVKKGLYKGQEVWFSVQIFGRPISLCTSPSTVLSDVVDTKQTQVTILSEEVDDLKKQIELMTDIYSDDYHVLVNQYNALVAEYNPLVETLKEAIILYNKQVQSYNACLAE